MRRPVSLRYLPLLLLPILIGLVGAKIVGPPYFQGVDPLPTIQWWVRKTASLSIWTAAYEEVAFRVTLMAAIFAVYGRFGREGTKTASWTAIGVSSVLFGLAHLSQGAHAALFALAAGAVFAWVLLKTRNIEALILAHLLTDLALVRWSTPS